jgi:tetratricopeptide (TPR) repeat protein
MVSGLGWKPVKGRLRRAAILGLGLLLSGCAGHRLRHGADWPEWEQVTSPHFVLRTNLSRGAGEAAVYELEALRTALVFGAFGMEADPPGRLQAILFRDPEGMMEFVDRRVDGYVTSTPSGPLLVSAGSDLRGQREARVKLLHELAHYLSSFSLLRQPRWFAEGMAEYLETLELSGHTVRLGAVHAENLKLLKQAGTLPLEALWSAEEAGSPAGYTSHFYASAWIWFHFLADKYPGRMRAYEQMLRRAEDPVEGFASAFVNSRNETLEDELQRYLVKGKFDVQVEEVHPPHVSVHTTPMTAPDVHAMRAELFLDSPARRTPEERNELARWELTEALHRDAHHVGAVILWADYQSAEERLVAARQLVQARPEDGRAWTFLAGQLEGDPAARDEREKILEKAVRLTPDDPAAINNLAWDKVNRGDAAVGLQLAERAVRMAPWSPAILDTYAAGLFKVGRCPEARTIQQRAVDLLHDEVSLATRQQLIAALMQYRRRCPAELEQP